MNSTVTITSTENQQIKETRKLQRRRQRYRDRLFLVEGVRLVRDALESGAQIHRIFYAPEVIGENEAAQSLLMQCQARDLPCFSCSPEVFHTLTETVTPQGIVAVIVMAEVPLPSPLHFTLILDQVRDPGNAGTLVRTAAAAGVDVVIFGPETVDPYNDKVVRAGMGAHFRLPLRSCATWPAIHAMLAPEQRCFVAEAGADVRYDLVDWRLPCALIVGGEASGASSETTEFAQSIAIPMHSQVESLNAATAGAVILFEAARQRRYSLLR